MTGASLFQIHSITERIREQQLPGDGIGCRCSNLERLGRMRRVGPLSIHWKCPVYIGLRRGTKGQMPLTLPCAPHSQAGSENGKRSGNCQRTEPFSFFLDGEVRVWMAGRHSCRQHKAPQKRTHILNLAGIEILAIPLALLFHNARGVGFHLLVQCAYEPKGVQAAGADLDHARTSTSARAVESVHAR